MSPGFFVPADPRNQRADKKYKQITCASISICLYLGVSAYTGRCQMQNVISFKGMEGSIGILAAQELKAALGICCGLGNKEIARELDCSPATIKKSIERIFYKLGISSRSAVPTELFYRGIARKLSMIMCVVLVCQATSDGEQLIRVRQGGSGGERKIETLVVTRRAECALAVV